ncbi:MAG: hypothetical protein H5T82_01245, partial [Demequina sp.]|nr:hypothetical protein [Demequina sp.]
AVDVFGNGAFIVLDTTLTPELEAEGYARDLIRSVQDERKSAGLNVSDRISLTLTLPAERVESVTPHLAFIAAETLAYDPASGDMRVTVAAGDELAITVNKA